MKTWKSVSLLSMVIAMLAGCAITSRGPGSRIVKPGDFKESGRGFLGQDAFRATKVVENGQIKKIIIEEYLYGKKIAEFHLDFPEGATEIGFTKMFDTYSIIYLNPNGVRTYQEWALPQGVVFYKTALIPLLLQLEWELGVDGKWVLKHSRLRLKPAKVIRSVKSIAECERECN